MKHIELHTIDSHLDADSAVLSGLLDEHFFATDCNACGDEVGALDRFEPYVIVLDDKDRWFLCSYCAEVVTDPTPPNSTYDAYRVEGDVDEDGFFEVDDA